MAFKIATILIGLFPIYSVLLMLYIAPYEGSFKERVREWVHESDCDR